MPFSLGFPSLLVQLDDLLTHVDAGIHLVRADESDILATLGEDVEVDDGHVRLVRSLDRGDGSLQARAFQQQQVDVLLQQAFDVGELDVGVILGVDLDDLHPHLLSLGLNRLLQRSDIGN